jgi:hypothetical protein
MSQVADARDPDTEYRSLYKSGGVAAFFVAFLTVTEIIAFAIFPQPSTISDWFILFQVNPIVGLLDFWGLEVLMFAMFAIVFLALYVVLNKVSKSWMAIALTLALLGIAIFFATNNPISMLSLSRKYAAATTDVQRSMLLAAGEAVLANTNQRTIGGFNIGLLLVSIAGLIVSLVMRRSTSFRRLTAYVGILTFGLSLADYLRQAFTSSVIFTLLLVFPGALFVVVWFSLVGRRLLQLGRIEG